MLAGIYLSFPCAASEPFPVFSSIEANVRFWIDVYGKFPTTKGILHDSLDLSIVYGVIDLLPPEKHGAKRENDKRIRVAREKYGRILQKLSENMSLQDPEAQEVAALFGPDAPRATFKNAIQNIRCQIGQKDRFEEGVIRSHPYLPEIKEIFRSRGLPEDLAYLPHVESSFNLRARSKAGAAGIWQFTRSTGKKFMKVSRSLDERRDPIRSSKAAAQLLKENHERLRSWPLAITAYNHGVAGLLKAKKSKGSEEAIFSHYSSRRFKFASRNYYSEFLAARHVVNNYEQYFSPIEDSFTTGQFYVSGHTQISGTLQQDYKEVGTVPVFIPSLQQRILE